MAEAQRCPPARAMCIALVRGTNQNLLFYRTSRGSPRRTRAYPFGTAQTRVEPTAVRTDRRAGVGRHFAQCEELFAQPCQFPAPPASRAPSSRHPHNIGSRLVPRPRNRRKAVLRFQRSEYFNYFRQCSVRAYGDSISGHFSPSTRRPQKPVLYPYLTVITRDKVIVPEQYTSPNGKTRNIHCNYQSLA
jgi:hypothetical protein